MPCTSTCCTPFGAGSAAYGPNCRLATVEDRLLGRPRVDDLPGSEAPAAWRRFLLTGETEGVRRVLTHNARDLVSLAHALQQLLALDGAAQR